MRLRAAHVIRDFDILSPAFQHLAAVWGWHAVGWEGVAGKSPNPVAHFLPQMHLEL